MPSISLTQSNIQTALRSFLLSLFPSGVDIILGQENRVPEPQNPNFIVFYVMGDTRLSTNVDAYNDCTFTASIVGNLMMVSAVQTGAIAPGAVVYGPGIAPGTAVVGGSASTGLYTVNIPQNIPQEQLACGSRTASQSIQLRVQMDVHGPAATDNARIVTTMFRDTYAVEQFQAAGFPDVTPLYADDPKQIPYTNAESQIETRWVIDAAIQAVPVVQGLPQQFTSTVSVTTTRIP